MKRFFVILFSFVLIFSFSACKKKDDISKLGENLTTYNLSLDLDCENKSVSAVQTINYINNTDNILKVLKLHLYPQFFEEGATETIVPSTKVNNAYPNGMSFADFNVDRLRVDDIEKSVVYEQEFDSILNVELNSSLMPNEKANILIEYSFTLPNCCHRFGYGNNTINLANFYPILCVYEKDGFNVSGYHANGDPFFSDMANYNVEITLDKNYLVASSGVKVDEKTDGNKKTLLYNATLVRDFAMVVSDKFNVITEKVNDVNVDYFYINDQNPTASLKAGKDAISTFSKLFGDYPYQNFAIVECDFVHGGMEFPNLVMINTQIENTDDYLNVIIHETAHQWWYGIVGNNQFEFPWLDEALTEFSTILFYDYNEGYNFTHKQMVNSSQENYSLFFSIYEDVLGSIDTSMRAINEYQTEPEYTYCTYVKGVLMYESLYQLIGEKNFVKSLQHYFENNKFTNANPDNLIDSFSKSTGKDLTNFFSSWINGKVVIR